MLSNTHSFDLHSSIDSSLDSKHYVASTTTTTTTTSSSSSSINSSNSNIISHDEASWRNGALSDWTIIVGSGDDVRSFHVHKYSLGLGERSSAFFYNHFNQPSSSSSSSSSNIAAACNTTHLALGRALLCKCGAITQCECSSNIRHNIDEIDRVLVNTFNEVLEYIYEGTLEPSEDSLLSMWALADYLQMHALSMRLREYFMQIVSHKNAHSLLTDCLRLRFGAADVIPRCLSLIASNFSSYTFEQISVLGADVVAAILQHELLQANAVSIGVFVGCFIRTHQTTLTQQQFIHFLSFLGNDERVEIQGIDALYILSQLQQHEQANDASSSSSSSSTASSSSSSSSSSTTASSSSSSLTASSSSSSSSTTASSSSSSSLTAFKALQARCFDAIASSLNTLDADEFVRLPHALAVNILQRDNLAVDDEDDVYALIRVYIDTHRNALSDDKQLQLWSTCRFAFVSAQVMYEASQLNDIPSELVMQGAILYKMIQNNEAFARNECRVYPRVNTAFNASFVSNDIGLTNKQRTAVHRGRMAHHTLFSRQSVCIAEQANGASFYWEFELEGLRNVQGIYIGVSSLPSSMAQTSMHVGSSSLLSWAVQAASGKKVHAGRSATYGAALTRGDTLGICLRCNSGSASLTFYKNGVSMGRAYLNIQGTIVPAVTLYRKDQAVTLALKPQRPNTSTPALT